MNRLFLAVGLLSAGMAFGQNQTTGTSSTTSTSNYNSSNTNNENSRNATMGTSSNTRPTSTTGTPSNRNSPTQNSMGTGTSTGSYSNSSTTGGKSYNSNRIGTDASGVSTDSYSNSSTTGNSSNYNSNSMGTGTSTTTPSTNGSYNSNSMGTGASTTTPSTTDSYNSGTTNNSSTTTTNSSYSTSETTARPVKTKDYKNFAYGIYAGLNSTRFRGESIDTENPAGRVGYQAGLFVRGGGRLFGQIGAEYFASSSNYFRPGDGQKVAAIRDQINIQYVQIPVYIGYKLTESDRGISAIRVQAGIEYANRINSSSGRFNLSNSEVKSGSFNALGQLGFDIGPFLIDLTYHHGLSNAVQINTFQGSSRRIASASIGFKF